MTDSNSKTSSSVPPAANPLATEPISHLIRKYSIPTRQIGNYVYAPKADIDNLYKDVVKL